MSMSKKLFHALYANADFKLTGWELVKQGGQWNRFTDTLMCNRCGYCVKHGQYDELQGIKLQCPNCLQGVG